MAILAYVNMSIDQNCGRFFLILESCGNVASVPKAPFSYCRGPISYSYLVSFWT